MKKQLKKHFKKIGTKIAKHILLFLFPFLIILFLACMIVDFLFMHVPKVVNAAENQNLKNYAIEVTDKANISNLKLKSGEKLDAFCDSEGKDLKLALKWSDLYAMVLIEDNTSLESFNVDKKEHIILKSRFKEISKDLAPAFIYKPVKRKITVTVTEKNKLGIEVKKKKVIENQTVYLLTDADTIFGHYHYDYEETKETRTDSAGEWNTNSTELISSNVLDKYDRLDKYLKKKLKLKGKEEIEDARTQFLELSKSIENGNENIRWLIDDDYSSMSWELLDSLDIDPEIMDAIFYASEKYSIPPWLIMGFIYRESNFQPNLKTNMDYSGGALATPTLAQVGTSAWGLMQVTSWEQKAKACGYSNAEQALSSIKAQVDVGCYELVKEKFAMKMCNINPQSVDWEGDNWIEQTWLGCQAYNGLIYYNSNPTKTKEYAFTEYLSRSDGTGVFDMAKKYKEYFELNSGGSFDEKSLWPTPSFYTISSPFGWRVHPISKEKKYHNGIDIKANLGTKIISVASATVIQASDVNNGYGKCVIIRDAKHDYLYAHMSSISVKEGQKVRTGEPLGKVGSTGYSTGPHLHFGISIGSWEQGKWIDPLTIISKNAGNKKDFKYKFLFIGDSLTEGMNEVTDKDTDKTIFQRGHTVPTPNGSNSNLYYKETLNNSAQNVLLLFGYNDIFDDNSINTYVKNYTKYLQYLKSKCKGSKIGVISIPPAANKAANKNRYYKKANVQMKSVCSKLGIKYIDSSNFYKNYNTKRDTEGYHWISGNDYIPLMTGAKRAIAKTK